MGLPQEKIHRFSKELSDNIIKETKRYYKDLRTHEVSKEDAHKIVRYAYTTTRIPNPDEIDK